MLIFLGLNLLAEEKKPIFVDGLKIEKLLKQAIPSADILISMGEYKVYDIYTYKAVLKEIYETKIKMPTPPSAWLHLAFTYIGALHCQLGVKVAVGIAKCSEISYTKIPPRLVVFVALSHDNLTVYGLNPWIPLTREFDFILPAIRPLKDFPVESILF